MAAGNPDSRFRRYLILTFGGLTLCVVILEAVLIPLVTAIASPIISNSSPVQGFLVAQSALVVLAIPIIAGALVCTRLVRGRLASELEAAEAERRRYYAQRNLMLSDMAHDLRTPVMGISGLAHAMEDGMVTDEDTRRRYLHSIVAKSDKMGELATMLFDYIKLESEGYELSRGTIDLPQLLLGEAATLYTDAEDAGMELIVEVPEDPAPVFADKAQMARVVSNLISNAIRHNPAGTRIVLGLQRQAGVARIIVADNGPAIEGNPEELFEPFARGDSARTAGGTGLGLSIVKTIVDMHGYRIHISQPYGSYSKAFVVTCPVLVGQDGVQG